MKPYKAIHKTKSLDFSRNWDLVYRDILTKVTVLAISGNWAMVRRPRSVPYVCPLKELVEQ